MHDNVAPLVPVPLVIANVTLLLLVVITFLPRPRRDRRLRPERNTTVEPLGCRVNANFAADPKVIVKLLLVAAVSDPSVAVSVYPVPALSILQPAKPATPLLAANGLVVHDKVAPLVPVPLVIANVTLLLLVVITFPAASSTATVGCVPNATPPVEPLGCCVNANFAADPTVIVKLLLVAAVSDPSVAVSVYPVPALSILQPAKPATPLLAANGLVVHDKSRHSCPSRS